MRMVCARSEDGGHTWITPAELPGQSSISGLMSIVGYPVVSRSGRIYRVYPKASKNDPYKADFASTNMFWRLEAQRAAVEKGRKIEKVTNIHHFYAKAGTGSLDLETIKTALASDDLALKSEGRSSHHLASAGASGYHTFWGVHF